MERESKIIFVNSNTHRKRDTENRNSSTSSSRAELRGLPA